MFWLLNNYLYPYPRQIYTWVMVRMRYETEKAILVLYDGDKIWIPKSRIRKIKFRKGSFWIYVRTANLNR